MAKIVNESEVSLPARRYGDRTAMEASTQTDTCKSTGHDTNQAEQLQQTTLLAGVAEAARRLLAIADFDTAVNGALEAIALATAIDRVFIVENHLATSSQPEFGTCPYEWTAEGVVMSREVPGRFPMVYSEIDGFSDWLVELKAGRAVQKTKSEMSEDGQTIQDVDQAFSVLTVPVFIEGTYWGTFGFDDCTTERVWSGAEIAVLKTAAASFAGALQRRADMLALETTNQTLRGQDVLLTSVNAAAQCLVANENLAEAIPEALRILGEGTRQDRAYVFENTYENGSDDVLWNISYEWSAPGIFDSAEIIDQLPFPMSAFPTHTVEPLAYGMATQFLTREISGTVQAANETIQTQSMVAVPITVSGRWWGVLGFDDCTVERVWSDSEVAVLETAAACIGSAIERDLSQKARELAERKALIAQERAARATELEAANKVLTTRDRWLETTAIAASELLSSGQPEVTVNAALKIIGENLACDRVGVMRHLPAPDSLGHFRVLYEWDSSGAINQMDTAELVEMPASDFADWTQRLMARASVGGPTVEQQEPFRSKLQALGALCAYAVPIFIEDEFWGLMFMDYCQEARQLTSAELAVFETTATCVGSAIYQEQVQRDRAAQERARLIGSVAQVANLLLRSADYTTVLPNVVKLLGEAVECDRCTVIKEQKNLDRIFLLTEWTRPSILATIETESEMENLLVWSNFPLFHEMYKRGDVANFLVADIEEPARGILSAQGCTSMLIVPIMVQGQCWGEIGFDNCGEPRLYDEAEIAILQVAAESIASAIARQVQDKALRNAEKAVLEEREKAARDRATELAKINEAIGQTLNTLTATPELDEFLGQILTKIAEPIGACKAHLFLYEESTNTLHQHVAIQDGEVYQGTAPNDPEMFHHPISADLGNVWQTIVESPKPFTWDERNPEAVDSYWPESVAWHQAEGHLSSTCACMRVGHKPIGFIGFAFRHLPTLTDEQLEFIQTLTNQATLSIHLTRLAEEAKQMAILQEQEKAARDRVTELAKTNEAISTTLTTLATSPELDQFLGTILSEMVRPLSVCKAHLFLYDEPTHTLTQRVAIQSGQLYMGVGPNDPDIFNHPIPADITPGWNVIMRSGRPLTYDETQPYDEEIWWPESLVWHKAQGHKAITCIPLKAGDQPIGYIGFCFYDRTFLTDEQLEFMQALANQAIVAIQLTRLAEEAKQTAVLQAQEKAAQERAAQLTRSNKALKSSLDSLAQQPELDSFLQQVVNEAVLQTNAATGNLFLYDKATETTTLQVATDNNGNWRTIPDMALWLQPVPINGAPAFWELILKKKPVIVENLQETLQPGPHVWEPSIAWHINRRHTSFICVPLVLGDRVLGFLGLAFIGESTITQDDIELAQALANQATLAIQLTQLAEESKQTAILQEQEKAASQRAAELANTNEALSQSLNVLTTESELDGLLGKILTQINQKLGVDDSHLFLYDSDTHTLSQHIAVQAGQVFQGNAPGDPDIFKSPIPADITRAWQIVSSASKPFTIDDNNPESAEFLWPGTPDWHASRGHQSATCACMKVGDQPIGFIGFAFCDRTVLTNEQLEFIQALTNQATLSIQLTRLAEQAQTAALSAALNDERTRLAREIHDTLAQTFTGVSLQLEAAKSAATENFEDALYHVDRAGNLARQGLSEARRSVQALRSQALETDTLPNALRTALQEMTQSSPTQAHFILKGTPHPLPEDIQTNLLRIGQEATTNALRHAGAATLTLTLEFTAHQIRMSIADDGQGCNLTSLANVEGFGLVGMRERVHRFDGQFSFVSTPGAGTVITIAIPIDL